MTIETSHESIAELVTKASPPVAVSVAHIAGMSLSDFVLWLTAIYTILMIGHKLYKIYREFRKS